MGKYLNFMVLDEIDKLSLSDMPIVATEGLPLLSLALLLLTF